MVLPLKKTAIPFLLLFNCSTLLAQTLISNEYEKGYVNNGQKVSFWEYYDHKGNLDLKINHDNGKVVFLKPDTTEYVVKKNDEWVRKQLRVYPKYIGSEASFYMNIASSDHLIYPDEALKNSTEGYVYVSFIVDSTGMPGNFKIEKDIGDGCGQAALQAIEESAGRWIPAQIDGKTYPAKFLMPFQLQLSSTKSKNREDPTDLPEAKHLHEVVITGN